MEDFLKEGVIAETELRTEFSTFTTVSFKHVSMYTTNQQMHFQRLFNILRTSNAMHEN